MNAPLNEDELAEAMRRHNEQVCRFVTDRICGTTNDILPPTITVEDQLRGAVVEALFYLDKNSPPGAHAVLTKALKL